MKTKKICLLFFELLFFCSCSDVLYTTVESNSNPEQLHTIPLEDALSSLEDFMIETGMRLKTKGDLDDYIENYFTVSTPITKSHGYYDNVLYVVNFIDNGGYALLSADNRIPDDIIAITDYGYASEDDFSEPVFDRVPSDNDDLSLLEFDELVESGILAAEQSQVNYECLLYAMRHLETNKDDVIEIGSPCDPGPGGGGNAPVTYQWKVLKEVPRMLNTAWTQSTANNDIFNKYCPEVGVIWRSIAPAGCVCIATSQIIAYHEHPNMICNNIQIDFPLIKQIYSYDNIDYRGTEESRDMLANFCICVGGLCNIQYHSIFNQAWGFAWPWDAKSCLESLGYQNVALNWGYDESRVLTSLDAGCPVFMSAIRKLWTGHAWVIDGYIMRDYISSLGVVTESQTLIHCNWGWHGIANGYFTSGIFHTDEAVIPDNVKPGTEDRDYWYAFNTITYDKPQN